MEIYGLLEPLYSVLRLFQCLLDVNYGKYVIKRLSSFAS